MGDQGKLTAKDLEIDVLDTQKIGNFHLHICKVNKGSVKLNSKVKAEIDSARRQAIVCNHSATHLMHSALRNTFLRFSVVPEDLELTTIDVDIFSSLVV